MSSILTRAHSWLVYAGAAYVSLLALLALEPVQRSLIYLHQIRFPFNAQFDRPDIYGFARAYLSPII
jgi:abhydrolase domain-containing protein 12